MATILLPQALFQPGVYESPVFTLPAAFSGISVSATRVSWPNTNCIQVQVFINNHPITFKWGLLIGFIAGGQLTSSGVQPLVSTVRRKVKPATVRQLKVVVTILQAITTAISAEFL